MSEQEVSERFVVTLEGFGQSYGRWETAGGARADLEQLGDDLGKVIERHRERVLRGPHGDRLADEDEFTPGHPGPSTGHS
jgi:hypothetical protein